MLDFVKHVFQRGSGCGGKKVIVIAGIDHDRSADLPQVHLAHGRPGPCRALDRDGRRSATNTAMMATTANSSISVNPRRHR